MTEPQLKAKIEYCVLMAEKHDRLMEYFDNKLSEYREDLVRMRVFQAIRDHG